MTFIDRSGRTSTEYRQLFWDERERCEELEAQVAELQVSTIHDKWVSAMGRIEELEAQLAAAHTLIHQIEDDIKFTGSEINVRKSINNYRAAIKGDES